MSTFDKVDRITIMSLAGQKVFVVLHLKLKGLTSDLMF